MLITVVEVKAQNVTSPYSIIGLGDIQQDEYGRYSNIGGASVSRRDGGYQNFSNPASLTAMPYKNISFDIQTRGRVSNYKVPGLDTLAGPSKDLVIKSLGIAFKLSKKDGIGFGLRPFSSVNYSYYTINTKDAYSNYLRYSEGNGGLYQGWFSYARSLGKRLSAGVTGSWIFGTIEDRTQYYNAAINLDVTKKNAKAYNSTGIKLGLQYYSSDSKKWKHQIGFTGSVYTTLIGENTIDYYEGETLLYTGLKEDISFKAPASISLGYTLANRNGISMSIQGNYDHWNGQNLNVISTKINDAAMLSFGLDYARKLKMPGTDIDKYHLGIGAKLGQSYISINGKPLQYQGITFGGGKNFSSYFGINAGVEIGQRGSSSLKQIKEKYVQFNIGITMKDFWFGTKHFGRYN